MIIKKISILFIFLFAYSLIFGQIRISNDKRYFITEEGQPFFWLADTAWELFHRLSKEEAKEYLENRAEKGFNVILAVGLAELDGINEPNFYGEKPLINGNLFNPNKKYFDHIDFVIKEAEKLGLTIAFLPTWGDKWFLESWGIGPEIFTPENAIFFGEWLAKRYNETKNIVWVLGGDRNPQNNLHKSIIRSMAQGIMKIDKKKHLITYHPSGGTSSFSFFNNEEWIDFHMSQTGHKIGNPTYEYNFRAAVTAPNKLHINAEPNYEDHPNDWKPMENGWMDEFDVRQAAYWNILSGGPGHSYGNHNIWQMYTEQRTPINFARTHWQVALNHPGAKQMGIMKKLFEKRPWYKIRPFQSAIIGENKKDLKYKVAAKSDDNDFMMIYIPYGDETKIDISSLSASRIRAWWFNPRDGKSFQIGIYNNSIHCFTPTSMGRGSDWILVLENDKINYPEL